MRHVLAVAFAAFLGSAARADDAGAAPARKPATESKAGSAKVKAGKSAAAKHPRKRPGRSEGAGDGAAKGGTGGEPDPGAAASDKRASPHDAGQKKEEPCEPVKPCPIE